MHSLAEDLRAAARLLARRPLFLIGTSAIIALGIGATTAMFTVARSVLLEPLPYEHADRLVFAWGTTARGGPARGAFSPPDWLDLRTRSRSLEEVAVVNSFSASLLDGGEPEQIATGVVSANFFDVLGVRPLLGRSFLPADDTPLDTRDPRSTSVVILDHALWVRRFGADRDVIGRIISVGGTSMEVIGVLPSDFRLHLPPDAGMSDELAAWTPLRVDYANAPRAGAYLKVVGRLREGASIERAQQEASAIARDIRQAFPPHAAAGWDIRLVPMHADVVAHVVPSLVGLFGAVAVLLLIACANVMNLFLVRLAAREREIALRLAIGGTRRRITRQLLAEGLVIAGLGAAGGVVIAAIGTRLLLALQPPNLPRTAEVSLDLPVLLFAIALAAGSALLFGWAPALLAARQDLATRLRERFASGGRRWSSLRRGLVVAEVGLSLVLLVGAGLLVRSVLQLQRVEIGFEPRRVLTFGVSLPFTRYRGPERWTAFFHGMEDRLTTVPGVRAVGTTNVLPASGATELEPYALESGAEGETWGNRTAAYRVVTPGFFDALSIPLLSGRLFTRDDATGRPYVVVVDEAFADRAWPGERAVGKRLEVSAALFDRGYRVERVPAEVIGVVRTVPWGRADVAAPGTIYMSYAQQPLWNMRLTVASQTSAAALVSGVRREVSALDADLPMFAVRALEEVVAETLAPTRFMLALTAAFAVVAALLASIGLYGVLAYAVRQRERELCIHLAMGATPGRVAWRVVKEGVLLAGAGVVVGGILFVGAAPLLSEHLALVSPTDAVTWLAVVALLGVVALTAAVLPARRAAGLDPARSLRDAA